MNLPTKSYSSIALICCGGILAVAATLYLKSREPVTPEAQPAVAVAAPVTPPVTAPTVPLPAPEAPPTVAATSTNAQPYTKAQITQWVAPIALYPDSLLSQVLMASTYPASVVQAVQWSKDNPTMQGDAAIQAVAGQPWDASVKSLVAFPQLTGMMGENPEWVENLGNAFLAQPQDVMDAVQDLRKLAQQTGSLKSSYQQTVTTSRAPAPTISSGTTSVSTSTTTVSSEPTVIRIESANPEVVYVPNYNPTVVYGSNWPYTSAPPVYLPPPPGQQFADSFVRGFGYSLGVATTYAIFSNIDWDDDDHHDDHHHNDDYHGGDRGYQHNGDNININVNNFNRISGENLRGQNIAWQHNSAYRGNVPYPNDNVAQRFHQTNVPGGLSTTRKQPGAALPRPTNTTGGLSSPNRDNQRQAAMSQLQQRTQNDNFTPAPRVRDAQRRAASQQLSQKVQRDNFRGYDAPVNRSQNLTSQTRHATPSRATAQRVQQSNLNATQRRTSNDSPRVRMEQRSTQQLRSEGRRNSALSGNESRAPNWQAQQSRGLQSRQASGLGSERQSRTLQGNRASSVGGERNGGGLSGHRELHRR